MADAPGWKRIFEIQKCQLHPLPGRHRRSTNAGSSVMQWDDVGAPDENWMPTQSLLPNGSYKIIATTTGNVLDCSGNSNTDGTGIDLWTYWDGPNQKWYIQSLGNGYYSIRNLSDGVIGRSLDCTGASPNDGTVIQLWTGTAGPAGVGYYTNFQRRLRDQHGASQIERRL